MSLLRGLRALALAYLVEMSRSKTAIFWTLAFPLFFLIGFAIIFGGGEPQRVSYVVPGVLTISVISATFFGISMNMVNQRENGVFRRFRVTPVSGIVVVLAHAVTSLVSLATTLALQLIVAKFAFKITIAGSLTALVVVCLAGAAAFIPLGLLVGSVARDMKTAPAITNLIFFPMMFLSGSAVPLFFLPDWLKAIARLLPSTYLVETLQGVLVRGDTLAAMFAPLFILLLTCVVGFAVNGLLFRWESTEPLRMSRLALAVGCLTLIYLGAAFVAPALKIAEKPRSSTSMLAPGEKGKTLASGFEQVRWDS